MSTSTPNPHTTTITIEVDTTALRGCSDSYLVMLWHLAQANPVPFGDKAAGELVEKVGREIIRRWLGTVEPELWHHQGRDHGQHQLMQLGSWPGGVFTLHAPADQGA